MPQSLTDGCLLTDACAQDSRPPELASQPTRSWQTAQCTKPICCPSNCYFGSTLEFQHIAGSDKILVGWHKREAQKSFLSLQISSFLPHTHIHLFYPWLWKHHLSRLPPLIFAPSAPGALLPSSLSVSSPSFLPWMFCSAVVGGRGEDEGGEEEVLPPLVKQQLGNSSGSNKCPATLPWLMPAYAHRTITGLFSTSMRSLDSVTMWAAKHTEPVVCRRDHTEKKIHLYDINIHETYSWSTTNETVNYIYSNYRETLVFLLRTLLQDYSGESNHFLQCHRCVSWSDRNHWHFPGV